MAEEPKQPSREGLEKRLGYRFSSRERLTEALVHSSFAHERGEEGLRGNGRLEFLGDAVLELAVSDILTRSFPELTEGNLTKLRAALVNKSRLAEKAGSLGLGDMVLLGKGEERKGGREKPSILADTLEAVLGAVYLDGGLGAATAVVEKIFSKELSGEPLGLLGEDHKTLLQERVHSLFGETPEYVLAAEEGPDHRKSYQMEVKVGEKVLGRGRGRSKKRAQQAAAKEALKRLGGEV